MKPHIVLVGTGYTTVWVVKYLKSRLGKSLQRGDIKITFVSDTPYHSFHGFTGEFVSGSIPMRFKNTEIKQLFPFVDFIRGKFQEVDQQRNSIEYINLVSGEKETLKFDQLVIGIGSRDKSAFIKYAHSVKKPKGLNKTRAAIMNAISKAQQSDDPIEIKTLLHFVIIGGGIAGIEVASNLREQFKSLEESYDVLKSYKPKITVIHSGDEIMPQIQRKMLIRYAKKCLKKQEVDLLLNTFATRITDSSIQLSNGEEILSQVKISTIGQQVQEIVGVTQKVSDKDHRLDVNEFLQLIDKPNIWAGGDIARVIRPYFKTECRADALWAIKHGTRIGKNIASVLKNRKMSKFNYPGLGYTVSFGYIKGFAILYGIPLFGPVAWLNRFGFFLYFMPSRIKALHLLKAFIQSEKEYEFKPETQIYLNPEIIARYTSSGRSVAMLNPNSR